MPDYMFVNMFRITNIMNSLIVDTSVGGARLQSSNGVSFILQWGYYTSTSTSAEKTVTWPVGFPKHLINVLTLAYAPSGQNFNTNVKAATLTNCVFRTVDGNGVGTKISFYWCAVGY